MHINAGVAGLVLALVIGKRVGFKRDPMRPHSLPLTMIGAGLLWVGWYGFNVGSIVFGDDCASKGAAANLAQFYSETGARSRTPRSPRWRRCWPGCWWSG